MPRRKVTSDDEDTVSVADSAASGLESKIGDEPDVELEPEELDPEDVEPDVDADASESEQTGRKKKLRPKPIEISDVVTDKQREARTFAPPVTLTHIIVDKSKRVTSNQMTLYEYTQILGIRALQIERTGVAHVPFNGLTRVIDIAIQEIVKRRCPLSVIRRIGNNVYELWEANEMEIPFGHEGYSV